MPAYTLEISDGLTAEIQAEDDNAARREADKLAKGRELVEVLVYRQEGGFPFYGVRTDGRGELR